MDIVEEVARRRTTIGLNDPHSAYPEIRDLLERRMSFDDVVEEKYYNDVDEGIIRSRIKTVEYYDARSKEEMDIYLFISKPQNELDIQIKAKIITTYEVESPWKRSLWYYAWLSLYDKLLYGKVRHEHVEGVEEKADQLLERVRNNVEVNYSGG